MTPDLFDISFALTIYFVLVYRYKQLNKSLFINPISTGLLVFAISIASVNYFYRIGNMNDKEYFILMFQFLIYFIFIFVTPYFIKKKYFNLSEYMNISNFDIQLTKIIFYIAVFIGIVYMSLFWMNYSSGSERFIFNRNMRELMLFNTLFSIWALYMSSVIYSKTKKKTFLYYAFILIVLSAFMGSRGAAMQGFLIFLFFYLQCNKIKKEYFILLIIIFTCLVILPTQFMYGNALEMILNRVFLSADIYLWSFVVGDYKPFIDYYDPISYVLHPFSSLIGIRGYEYGFGAQILETANLVVDGTGPNDQMPMLGMIFYNDCLLCISVFTIIFSLIMMFTIVFVFYLFRKTNIDLSLRVLVFSLLYYSSINIFIGVNAFSFNIVILLLGFVVYFIFYIFKKIGSKKALNNDEK